MISDLKDAVLYQSHLSSCRNEAALLHILTPEQSARFLKWSVGNRERYQTFLLKNKLDLLTGNRKLGRAHESLEDGSGNSLNLTRDRATSSNISMPKNDADIGAMHDQSLIEICDRLRKALKTPAQTDRL